MAAWGVTGGALASCIRMGACAAVAWLTLAVAAWSQPAPAPHALADAQSVIRTDPAIVKGVLPNGLRYEIMHNATPVGAVSIRMAIDVGSYDEGDDEREAAHFVEHMTFRSPRSFPDGAVERSLSAEGVGFGRDLNAATRLFSTVYRLDLPKADDRLLDLSFRWLRDVADGTDFNPDAVTLERGVVLAERESRLSPPETVREKAQEFEAPGFRSVARDKVNDAGSIVALDSARLSAFYRRWYRPERAVMVVVGDLPLEVLRRRVEQTFSSWSNPTAAPIRRAYGTLDEHRGEDEMVITEPGALTQVLVCRVHAFEPVGADDVARLRRLAVSGIWRTIINRRLVRAASMINPPYVSAVVASDIHLREVSDVCMFVTPIGEAWEPAIRGAQAELDRFAADGPTQSEADEAVSEMRAEYRGARGRAGTRTSNDLAAEIAEKALRDEVMADPAEMLRAFDSAVDDLQIEDIRASFQKDWSGAGPFISVVSPRPPAAEAVRAAWARGKTEPAAVQYADGKSSRWAYKDFGKPGRVSKRESFTSPEFARVSFSNGVILNFKQTKFEAETVVVLVSFGAGRREIPNDRYLASILGASVFKMGGLGKHDFNELSEIFRDTQWDASLSVLNDRFVLSGKTFPNGLSDQLAIMAAFVSDPGFRKDLIDARLPTGVDYAYRLYRTSPPLVLGLALQRAIAPDSPSKLPSKEDLLAIRTADFERLFRPALTGAPLEVTIVGDVDEKTATELVARSLGALPSRSPASRVRPDTWFLRFPEQIPSMVRATHEGPRDKALIGVVWPLYVATPARRREEIALNLLTEVFSNGLRRRIRAELGKSYDPTVLISMPDDGDQGQLIALAEASPDDIDIIGDEIRKFAGRLASGDISEEAIEAARAPMVSDWDAKMATNRLWALALAGSTRGPVLADMIGRHAMLSGVTTAEVRKAASTWLARSPIVVIAAPAPINAAAATPTAKP